MAGFTDENFYFRVARAYFYRAVLRQKTLLGWLTHYSLLDVDGVHWPKGRMILEIPDGTKMFMAKERGIQFLCEVRAWDAWYLPEFPLTGATVIDGGSGCGESDYYFRKHGATKVIAIDFKREFTLDHETNAKLNHWKDTTVINAKFDPEQLRIAHDFVKLDVEGGEKLLMEGWVTPEILGPARIELHPQFIGQETCDALIKKFDLEPISSKSRLFEREPAPGMMWRTRAGAGRVQPQTPQAQDINAQAAAWCEHD